MCVTDWVVPEELARAAEGNDALRAWVGRLPPVVAALSEEWGLEPGSPFQPGGSGSWVAPVTAPGGADVVLKVAWRHPEAQAEADGLRHWAGRGTVGLVRHLRLPEPLLVMINGKLQTGVVLKPAEAS